MQDTWPSLIIKGEESGTASRAKRWSAEKGMLGQNCVKAPLSESRRLAAIILSCCECGLLNLLD